MLRLVAGGHRVTVLNRGRQRDTLGERVERLRGDRTTDDFARLLAGRSFDAAVDLAAYQPDDARRAVEVLDGRVGHYVVVSTGQVYLVREGCPRPAREEDYAGPLRPEPKDPYDRGQWDYGMGKRGLEDALVEAWDRSRFPSTRLRLPMVNGERDHFRRLERYLWRMLDGGPVLLPGGGEHATRHVYSGSVVKLILAILGRDDTFGQAYNVAQEETPSLRTLIETIAGLLGARPTLEDIPASRVRAAGLDPLALSPFSGTWMSFLDSSRAREQLGFRHEALASYLDKIVTAFLASPPAQPPPGYEHRAAEIRLAGRR